MAIQEFHPVVADDELERLRARLHDVRWPDRETVDDTAQGPPLAAVQELVRRWRDDYDWRRTEAWLHEVGQYRTEVDGLGVHFLHARSAEPDALPLLLCHGWPGSVLEFRHVVGPLTDPVAHGGRAEDAFHVVVPSMPGFGFSDKPTATGWGVGRVAQAWVELMEQLGYGDRWAVQGGDWGSAVADTLGRRAPRGLVGVHLNMALVAPTPAEVADATPEEQAMIDSAAHYQQVLSAYAFEQATRPQTVGYLLADNPVGLAAWIYAMFQDVSDSGGHPETVFDLDEILDDVMLYWLPNAGASSARLYWEGAREPAPVGPNPTPTGVSVFPREPVRASRRWLEARYEHLVHYGVLDAGGHFAALEQPAVFVDEVRETFRELRRR